ncbi:hypothetical protein Tco_1180408 [Tanacetum coccineum]
MRNRINLHIICDDSLLGTLKFVSKTQNYQQYGALIPDDMINQDIKDSKAYKTYYDFATGKATPKKARKYKKVTSPSRKPSPVLEEEPTEKPKRARKPAKKSTNVPTACVAIRDTPRESVPKNKTPTKVDRGKGMDLLSDASLLEAAQVLDESQDKTTSTDEGTGAKPWVPNVPKYLSETKNESWGDSGDDGSNDDDSDEVTKDDDEDDVESNANEDKETSDSEKTDSDEDENLNVNQNDDEEEEHEEEYVCTPDSFKFNDDEEEYDELYKDVDVKSLDAEREKERKGDAEMTDADKNTEGSMQSSSVSFDFASKFLNLENVPPDDNKVTSMMNVKVRQEESSTLAPPLLTVPIENLTQEHLVGTAFNLLKGTCKSRVELEYHFEECYKVVTDKLDWTNPEGHEYPFDLSKALTLIEDQGHQVVPANYFFNNDLDYLKGHKRYGSIAMKSSEVTHVKVVKKYDYGYLDEIIIRREDQQLYKFVEGDFPRLNLCDIEDMLLLLVQKKLSNLERGDLFDLNVALQMFTRRVVILKQVEDLQLGVKSYQKKLNITRPEMFSSVMTHSHLLEGFFMILLPAWRWITCQKRRWSKLDRKRSRIMINAIDQQLFERRLQRNLEKFIGGREYGNDFRLLERII